MDMQAWDIFLTGMELRQSEGYRSIVDKLVNDRKSIYENLGLREIIRMNALIKNLNVD